MAPRWRGPRRRRPRRATDTGGSGPRRRCFRTRRRSPGRGCGRSDQSGRAPPDGGRPSLAVAPRRSSMGGPRPAEQNARRRSRAREQGAGGFRRQRLRRHRRSFCRRSRCPMWQSHGPPGRRTGTSRSTWLQPRAFDRTTSHKAVSVSKTAGRWSRSTGREASRLIRQRRTRRRGAGAPGAQCFTRTPGPPPPRALRSDALTLDHPQALVQPRRVRPASRSVPWSGTTGGRSCGDQRETRISQVTRFV